MQIVRGHTHIDRMSNNGFDVPQKMRRIEKKCDTWSPKCGVKTKHKRQIQTTYESCQKYFISSVFNIGKMNENSKIKSKKQCKKMEKNSNHSRKKTPAKKTKNDKKQCGNGNK